MFTKNVYKTLKIFSNLLNRILRYCTQNSPWVCVIRIISNGSTTYNIDELTAKDSLNIPNLMQTFKIKILLQNYSTELLNIVHK